MKIFLVALLSIAMSVMAQFCLKAGMGSPAVRAVLTQPLGAGTGWTVLTHHYVVLGFVLYGLGAVIWLAVLAHWDVSKAYPLVGLGFIVSVAVGAWLGEQVTLERLAGVLLICAGVALVARS
jgi:multidrug transporter EmrE-like cation transporter